MRCNGDKAECSGMPSTQIPKLGPLLKQERDALD